MNLEDKVKQLQEELEDIQKELDRLEDENLDYLHDIEELEEELVEVERKLLDMDPDCCVEPLNINQSVVFEQFVKMIPNMYGNKLELLSINLKTIEEKL